MHIELLLYIFEDVGSHHWKLCLPAAAPCVECSGIVRRWRKPWCVRSVYTLALFSSLCDVGYMMLSVELWLLGAGVLANCMMPNEWYLFSEKRHSVSHYAYVVIMLVRNRSKDVYVLVRPWIAIDLMSRHDSCYAWSLWIDNTYCNLLQSEVLIVPGDSCSLVHMFIGQYICISIISHACLSSDLNWYSMAMWRLVSTTECCVCLQLLHLLSTRSAWYA